MATHLALLRGINVGGRNRVPMAELRAVVEALGHRDVASYIQSGNVVFSSDERDRAVLARQLHGAIADRFGVATTVVVLTRDEVAQAVAANPFTEERDPKRVHAVFHDDEPGPARVAEVSAALRRTRGSDDRDDAVIVGRTLYLHTPDGFGRSRLAERLTRTGTARNWATVTRLAEMLAD